MDGLFLFFVRRALRRNPLSELSFSRSSRALRLHLQGFPCTLSIVSNYDFVNAQNLQKNLYIRLFLLQYKSFDCKRAENVHIIPPQNFPCALTRRSLSPGEIFGCLLLGSFPPWIFEAVVTPARGRVCMRAAVIRSDR